MSLRGGYPYSSPIAPLGSAAATLSARVAAATGHSAIASERARGAQKSHKGTLQEFARRFEVTPRLLGQQFPAMRKGLENLANRRKSEELARAS
jgi:hypothetical protein